MEIEITVNTSHPLAFTDFQDNASFYNENVNASDLGFTLAMTVPEAIVTVMLLGFITFMTICGNILVILSVFTYKPLRIVQNFFIVSLAVADLTVAILVMPLNVVDFILGRWVFGLVLCEMWLTCDVLCCTASILNLCAIALDRYWAITDPINYAQKRTFKRVLAMIFLVWAISGVICLPPLIGWNNWSDNFEVCQLSSNQGYVIYSSCGSFYIPLLIMTLVYIKIFVATRRRLRERARASKIAIAQNLTKPKPLERTSSFTPSEANHNEDTCTDVMRKDPNDSSDTSEEAANHQPKTNAKTNGKSKTKQDKKQNRKQKQRHLSSKSGSKEHLHKQDSRRDSSTVPSLRPTVTSIPQFIEERQKISLSKERRAARTLGIIMGVFVVCWLPFFLMYVILPFCETCYLGPGMMNFITWLGYANSALNPVIYTIFNIDFRRAFQKLLKC